MVKNQRNFFFQSAKRNGKRKEINCIKKNGRVVTNQETILSEIVEYYKCLYSKPFEE